MADTLPIDSSSMARAALTPAPTADIARLDVDLQSLRLKREAAAAAESHRLRLGLQAEYRHLLHDEDPDSTTPALRVSLTKERAL